MLPPGVSIALVVQAPCGVRIESQSPFKLHLVHAVPFEAALQLVQLPRVLHLVEQIYHVQDPLLQRSVGMAWHCSHLQYRNVCSLQAGLQAAADCAPAA